MALLASEMAAVVLWVAPLSALIAALLSWSALRYGRRRGLIDQPGARRSHVQPTPRGGGIGIVVVLFAAALALAAIDEARRWLFGSFALALAAVAAIGWWDDHQPQPILRRLLVQAAASACFVVALWPGFPLWMQAAAVFALVCAINFTNFMDGINGLAATQAAAVAAVLLWALLGWGDAGWALLAAVLACACLGFLPFNLPRAKIFLGDVGSNALGFSIGAMLLAAWSSTALPFAAVFLLPSAFVLDAGLTLAQRMLRGRRWYAPHREHLYQWLVRSGASHVKVTLMYFVWTLAVSALVLGLPRERLPMAALMSYIVGALLWLRWRRRVLLRAREGV